MISTRPGGIAGRETEGAHAALAVLARRTKPAYLLLSECAGLIAIFLILATASPTAVVLPFISLTSFGLWGLADAARHASVSRRSRSMYWLFQLVVTLVGGASLMIIPLALGEVAIGTIIS